MTPEEIVKAALAGEVLSVRQSIGLPATCPDGTVCQMVLVTVKPDAIERLRLARESRSETR